MSDPSPLEAFDQHLPDEPQYQLLHWIIGEGTTIDTLEPVVMFRHTLKSAIHGQIVFWERLPPDAADEIADQLHVYAAKARANSLNPPTAPGG